MKAEGSILVWVFLKAEPNARPWLPWGTEIRAWGESVWKGRETNSCVFEVPTVVIGG